MSHLALAAFDAPNRPTARWAHDIRNTLATVGLHLETLERLSGSRGREIAHAAHALMSRAAAMCSEAMTHGGQADRSTQRRSFDLGKTIAQIANLLQPSAPDGFEIRIAGHGAVFVLADQQDVFRILFNLVHNAVSIARRPGAERRMTHVTLLVERHDSSVSVRIADDGPGLPQAVRKRLFRRQQSDTGGGIGLALARELAEQNGGALRLAETANGTAFVLELIGSAAMAGPVALRSLGKSAQH
jgi:signal transduction histidine kinase